MRSIATSTTLVVRTSAWREYIATSGAGAFDLRVAPAVPARFDRRLLDGRLYDGCPPGRILPSPSSTVKSKMPVETEITCVSK
jgi:hypothetical protein